MSQKEGERERENQYGGWDKLQGLERRKGMEAVEAEEHAELDELRSLCDFWETSPKFSSSEICNGLTSFCKTSVKVKTLSKLITEGTLPPCWFLVWYCPWGTNQQPSKISSNMSFHITMYFYMLEGGELHFLLFLWLPCVDLYLCRANEW